MVKSAITAYWYPETNFGDQLTPDILRCFGLLPLFSPTFTSCDVVATGSILELVPEDYDGNILGSGFLLPTTTKNFPKANILSVRGRLTAQKLSLSATTCMGDPGILVDRVYKNTIAGISKKYTLGIVPHYKDANFPTLSELTGRYPDDICVIDVRRKPAEVVAKIAACRNILSSSLHGLIVAHSLGLPAGLLHLGRRLRGGDFKFKDYYSAYDLKPSFYCLTGSESLADLCGLALLIEPEKIDFLKNSVNSVFNEFAHKHINK